MTKEKQKVLLKSGRCMHSQFLGEEDDTKQKRKAQSVSELTKEASSFFPSLSLMIRFLLYMVAFWLHFYAIYKFVGRKEISNGAPFVTEKYYFLGQKIIIPFCVKLLERNGKLFL